MRLKSGQGEIEERNKRRKWIRNYKDKVIEKVKELEGIELGEKKMRQLMSKREKYGHRLPW